MKKIPLYLLMLAASTSAFGAVTIVFNQVGEHVFMTATGSLDLTGLTRISDNQIPEIPYIDPRNGIAFLGQTDNTNTKVMYDLVSDQSSQSFGTGGILEAGGGGIAPPIGNDALVLLGNSSLLINESYISGTSFTAGAAFAHTTIEEMGIAAGTYVWTLTNDEMITMTVAPIPEPAVYTALLGLGVLGLGILRRLRR